MISSGLSNWQTASGFRLENDVVYGVYNGMGFAVACEDGGKLFTFMLSGLDEAFDAIEDLLVAQPSRIKEAQVGDVEGYLALFFEERGAEMPGQLMTALLDFVMANARACGFTVPRVCVKCGAPANKRSFYNDMVQPMCTACSEEERLKKRAARPAPEPQPEPQPAPEPQRRPDSLIPTHSGYNPEEDDTYDQYAAAPRQEKPAVPERAAAPATPPLAFINDTTDEGSMAKGVIGGILGGIAGLVPLVLSVIIGLELTVLCVVCGIGSVLGYIAMGGLKRKNPAMISTIVIAEVLSIAAFAVINAVAGAADGLTFFESLFTSAVDYINFVIAIVAAAIGAAITLDKLAEYIGTLGSNDK